MGPMPVRDLAENLSSEIFGISREGLDCLSPRKSLPDEQALAGSSWTMTMKDRRALFDRARAWQRRLWNALGNHERISNLILRGELSDLFQ